MAKLAIGGFTKEEEELAKYLYEEYSVCFHEVHGFDLDMLTEFDSTDLENKVIWYRLARRVIERMGGKMIEVKPGFGACCPDMNDFQIREDGYCKGCGGER